MIINAHVDDARATAQHLDCLGVTWLAEGVPGAGRRAASLRYQCGSGSFSLFQSTGRPSVSVPRWAGSCLLGGVLKDAGTSLSEFADFEPFEVDVLHPGRILPEKLVHIHALAQQFGTPPRRPADARSGRHFYDVFQPLGDDRVLDLLADPNQVEQIMASVEEVTRTYLGGNDDTEVCPKDGVTASSAFDTGTDVSLRLRPACEVTMPALYSETDPLPR